MARLFAVDIVTESDFTRKVQPIAVSGIQRRCDITRVRSDVPDLVCRPEKRAYHLVALENLDQCVTYWLRQICRDKSISAVAMIERDSLTMFLQHGRHLHSFRHRHHPEPSCPHSFAPSHKPCR